MSARWEDVAARARGLATHLLARPTLESLAGATDLGDLGARLADAGLPAAPEVTPQGTALELVARREAARRLRTLARWLGPRTSVVAVIFDDEDRRSLRAIIRGAVAGVPADGRLAGLIPTPGLPERALEELAGRTVPHDIATLLTLWGHPFGAPLLPPTQPEHPDLARIELALHRAFAARAVRGARRGGPMLRRFVTETIDLLNAEAALLLAGNAHELPPEEVFVEGGKAINRACFVSAATAHDSTEAGHRLGVAFRGTGYGAVLREAGARPGGLDVAVLPARLRTWHRQARLYPVSAAPVLEYVLRLRAQVQNLRTLIWTTAIGMPAALRQNQLLAT